MRPSGAHVHPGQGGGWAVVCAVAAVLVVAGAAVRAVARIPWWVWAAAPVAAVVVVGGVVAVVVHVWRAEAATFAARMGGQQELPAPVRDVRAGAPVAALPPVEQHLHFHLGDVSAADLAAVLAERGQQNGDVR